MGSLTDGGQLLSSYWTAHVTMDLFLQSVALSVNSAVDGTQAVIFLAESDSTYQRVGSVLFQLQVKVCVRKFGKSKESCQGYIHLSYFLA